LGNRTLQGIDRPREGGDAKAIQRGQNIMNIFWGTDLTRMPCTYYECITLFTEHLPWLQGEDLEWVMGRGICAWLDWPLWHRRMGWRRVWH
jgi:hypothetical protein